jgi:adenylate cyclase
MRVFIFTFLRFVSKSLIIIITKMCVLKYIGNAIIVFFPSGYNKLLACDKAVQCANSMITVIKNGINPILNQNDYPELCVKIGIDEGENVSILSLE